MSRLSLLLLLALVPLTALPQGVYKWIDDNGVMHFGDRPMAEQAERIEIDVYRPDPPPSLENSPDSSLRAAEKKAAPKIVMYSATWCGVCKQARAYFRKNRVKFTEYDVETSRKGKADYEKMKGKGVPIILVDGQRHNGFSAGNFDRLLGL